MKTSLAEIRFAEPDDDAALSAVHEAAWRGAYTGIIPHKSLTAMISRRHAGWWRRAIDRQAAVLVLEFNGAIAGYATLGRNRTGALDVEGEIYELYLRPEYQGVGFGRRLFRAATALLQDRGLKGLVVWALSDNETAMGFYSALGGGDIAEGAEMFEGRSLRKVAFVWP
jgi:ribosomal protein S18 acetylase RimI-like enzyme